MGISVVFTGIIVTIAAHWLMRREAFQPLRVVMVQTALIVIDKHTSSYMHGVHKYKTLLHAAFAQAFVHLLGNTNKGYAGRWIEPKFFAVTFHFDGSEFVKVILALVHQ